MAMDSSAMQEFYTEHLELDEESLSQWSTHEFISAKLEVVTFNWKSAAWALQIPRRMGGNASAQDLSADKKFMRQMCHMFSQIHTRWTAHSGNEMPVDLGSAGPAERKMGAQMDKLEFSRELQHVAEQQMRIVATVSSQTGFLEWGVVSFDILHYEWYNLKRIELKLQGASPEKGEAPDKK